MSVKIILVDGQGNKITYTLDGTLTGTLVSPTPTPVPVSTPGVLPLSTIVPASNSLLPPILKMNGLDKYGGIIGTTVPGGATGFFRLVKIGTRWVFATPLGTRFWMAACYGVAGDDYIAVLDKKYQLDNSNYALFQKFLPYFLARLCKWGFNTLGEYSSVYATPNANGYVTEEMPYIVGPLKYAWSAVVAGQVKELFASIDPTKNPNVWIGFFPDVFDPQWPIYLEAQITTSFENGNAWVPQSPWQVGVTPDDGDYLTGFGPADQHAHLGWLAAVGCPDYSKGCIGTGYTYTLASSTTKATLTGSPEGVNTSWVDFINYTKKAWVDYLINKYGTIEALNVSWESTYTTFGSSMSTGGWGKGTGVLDEAGQNAWIGLDSSGTTQPVNVRIDLDAFLLQLARTYIASYKKIITQVFPNLLMFSPQGIAVATRLQVWQAMAEICDAIQSGTVSESAVDATSFLTTLQDLYSRYGKPVFFWATMEAQLDSKYVSINPNGWGAGIPWGPGINYSTQDVRGQAVVTMISTLFSLGAPPPGGTTAEQFVVGIDWWDWVDSDSEQQNFGLVTLLDNAYDGKEAVKAVSVDEWGHAVGGEVADYGDFLTPVTAQFQAINAVIKGL